MCFDNKVNSILYVVRNIGRLPEEDEFFFEDGEDERVFFDKLTFLNIINYCKITVMQLRKRIMASLSQLDYKIEN